MFATLNVPLLANSSNQMQGYQLMAYILLVVLLFIFGFLVNILLIEFVFKKSYINRRKPIEHSTS